MFLIYLAYYWWDMRQLTAFCGDVKAGTPVSQLSQIANRHGIRSSWLKGDGVFDEEANRWTLYVPAASSVGANVCAIHHNKETVISTEIEID